MRVLRARDGGFVIFGGGQLRGGWRTPCPPRRSPPGVLPAMKRVATRTRTNYRAEISRDSPTAILMVMDQSTSMNQRLQGGQSKAAFLSDVLNKTLYTIITNCSKADGVRDYFHVGVVAYSGENARNGFQGALGDEALHVVSRLAEAPLRVETRAKKVAGCNGDVMEQSVRFPIW